MIKVYDLSGTNLLSVYELAKNESRNFDPYCCAFSNYENIE